MPVELKAEVRSSLGTRNNNRLRQAGRIPAVIYAAHKDAVNISVDGQEFGRAIHTGARVVILKLDGGDRQALIKDLQFDALGEHLLHVDFNEIAEGQTVTVHVPVKIKGVPKGIADGGQLSQGLHEIEVECPPAAIPERIEVDVSELGMGDAVHVSDLKLPQGVVAVTDEDAVVASCIAPRKEEEPAPAAEGLEPEVIGEKKEEEGEASAEKPAAEKKPAEKKEEKK